MSRASLAVELGRKGVELALREIGQSPEMRQARTLSRAMPASTPTGQRVVVLSPRDWAAHVQWEALIAQSLRLRGADVRVVTCGGGLDICDRVNTYEGPPLPCHRCSGYVTRALTAHGLPVDTIRSGWDVADDDWPELDALSLDELRTVQAEGLPLGRLVDVPVTWFLCNSNLAEDPLAGITLRRFLRSARRIAIAMGRLLDHHQPEVILLLNGFFLFEGIAAALAERRGIRIVSYERGFIDGTHFFAHGPSASRYDVQHLWDAARGRVLTGEEDERLDAYLADRRLGLRSFIQIWPSPKFETTSAAPAQRRRVALFTNVTWDSAAQGRNRAFSDLRMWIVDVVDQLGGRDDVELVVRIHPAEVRIAGWETREAMAEILAKSVGPLPSNVRVILPDDPLSSYSIMESCDVGLVYTSTSGLELAMLGKPVIVAGETHYAEKGFTLDANSPEHHRRLVEDVLGDPAAYGADTVLARRYANLFFFESVVEQPPAYEPLRGLVRLATVDPDDLRPGRHAGLDAICSGILHGTSFSDRWTGHPEAS